MLYEANTNITKSTKKSTKSKFENQLKATKTLSVSIYSTYKYMAVIFFLFLLASLFSLTPPSCSCPTSSSSSPRHLPICMIHSVVDRLCAIKSLLWQLQTQQWCRHHRIVERIINTLQTAVDKLTAGPRSVSLH